MSLGRSRPVATAMLAAAFLTACADSHSAPAAGSLSALAVRPPAAQATAPAAPQVAPSSEQVAPVAPAAPKIGASGETGPGALPDPTPVGTQQRSMAPRLGQEELRQRFMAFPGALTPIVAMGDQMVTQGLPMTLAYFETRAQAREILEFYGHRFLERGWSMSGLKETRKVVSHPALSATDPKDHLQMSVMVLSHGRDEPRTVILGLADLRPE
ncbi:MAG: hypothetical protein HY901_06660, partial [Deltaproteobacteria bacterium]|nr:hypothetical protein [Deltaproteobacteria bacterium]